MSVFAAMKCHTLGVGDLSLLSSRGIHIFIERAIVMTATAVINFMAKFVTGIDQNKDHILGPSTVAIAKKLKELILEDKLTIADLKGAGLEKLKKQYKNDVELEYHVDQLKADVLTVAYLSTEEKYATSFTKHFTVRYHIQEDGRQDFLKAEINNRSPDKVYSDKRIISVVRVNVKRKWGYRFFTLIVVRRSDKKKYEFCYADLPRLSLNDIEDINLNLTKPEFYFEEIDQKIPYIMSGTEKGVVYLNEHNIKSLMNLDEVHKFCDCTLLKIRDNLINMVNKNELGRGNKRLKSRDWSTKDIKRSNEMLDKIDQTLKHREQLRSKPNGKLLENSILYGPYVRRMIGDSDRTPLVVESSDLQTDDELTDKEAKQVEVDDQAIQTVLMSLPEDIYAAVNRCKVVQRMRRFKSTEGESIESYYHRFAKLINDFSRNKHIPKKIASNLKFLNNLKL
ncbi:hypothetical protein Tco_1457011 [Tanacetum coccineum]